MSLLRQAAKATFAAADLLLPTPKGPRVLIYHKVGTSTGQQLEVSREDFIWQLNWLVSNCEVVDLETAVRRWTEPDADRLVVLTFDDGYEDTYTTAFPLMSERGVPFTLYVSTNMVGNAAEESLSWDQIAAMNESGLMTIGAHTHTHCDLRTVDYSRALFEIERSNELIAERTSMRPRHFAYPWGYWAKAAHQAVAEVYDTAALGAPIARAPFDPHRLHRFPVQLSDGKRWFRSRLEGGLLTEERVRRRLRGYREP